MDLGLRDKHAIVTGGSQGIGKAIARELAREGADVAIVARKKEQLDATALELGAETGRRIIPLVADVTSREQVEGMVAQAATQLGGLHILVNSGSSPGGSAGATGPIETVVDEDLLRDFNTSLVHFTKTLAVQLGRFGITVNCIHPGTTRTERTPRLLAARAAELGITPEEAEQRTYAPDSPRGNAIGRMVDAAEVAYVAMVPTRNQ